MSQKSDAIFQRLLAQSRLRHGVGAMTKTATPLGVENDPPEDIPAETAPDDSPPDSPSDNASDALSGDTVAETNTPRIKKKTGRPPKTSLDDTGIRFVFDRSLQDQYACNDKITVHGDCKKWVQNYIDILGGGKAAEISPIVCTLAAEAGKIDRRTPLNGKEKGLGTLMALEAADITGSNLYRLHQVFCNKDFEKTVAVAAALHQGLIDPGILKNVLWYRSKEYTADGILADVRKKDRGFGYRP